MRLLRRAQRQKAKRGSGPKFFEPLTTNRPIDVGRLNGTKDWNEDLHPRDDHGRFGAGGGGSSDAAVPEPARSALTGLQAKYGLPVSLRLERAGPPGAMAYTQKVGGVTTISLSPDWTDPTKAAAALAQYRTTTAMRSLADVITHEYGHALAKNLPSEAAWHELHDRFPWTATPETAAVSPYASIHDEAIAEAFLVHERGGTGALADHVGSVFDKYYGSAKAERTIEFKVDRNAAKGKAATKLDAAETELMGIVHRWLDRMVPVVTSKLQGQKSRRGTRHWKPAGEVKLDPGNSVDAQRWRDELEQDVEPFITKLGVEFYASTIKAIEATSTKAKAAPPGVSVALGPVQSWVKRSKALRDALKGHVTAIGDFSDTVTEAIRVQIADAEAAGLSIGEMANAIADYVDQNAGFWAERVARTEVVGAANEAAHVAATDSGAVDTKTWLATNDPRTRPSHAEIDGEQVPIDEPFSNGLMFPGDQTGPADEVVNCFPGSTLVDSVGAVTGAVRRRYDGPMVQLAFASGNGLSVTPNHPLLTTHGWTAAGTLAVGDNLLRACVRERMTLGDPDVEHVPALLHEVVDALASDGSVERVLRSNVNLHGDVPDCDVDVVRANGQLGYPLQPGRGKLTAEPQFAATNLGLRSFASDGLARELGVAGALSTTRGVGGAGSGLSSGLRHASSSQHILVADASGLDACLSETTDNHLSADAVSLAQTQLGFAALVEADELVDVDVVAFHGDVFTLETSLGWYTANSVLVRNCRCTMLMGMAGNELDILGSDYTTASAEAEFKYSPDQERDDRGRFGSGGGGDGGGPLTNVSHVSALVDATSAQHQPAANAYQYDDTALNVNAALRGGGHAYTDTNWTAQTGAKGDLVAALDRAAAATPLKADAVVFRGAAMTDAQVQMLAAAGTFSDKGFLSATTSEHVASGYATARTRMANDAGAKPVLFRMTASKGTGAFQGAFGSNELVLERGTSWRVTGISTTNDRTIIEATQA